LRLFLSLFSNELLIHSELYIRRSTGSQTTGSAAQVAHITPGSGSGFYLYTWWAQPAPSEKSPYFSLGNLHP